MVASRFSNSVQLPLEFPLVLQAATQPRIRASISPQVAAAVRGGCARAENGDCRERIFLAYLYRTGEVAEKNFAEAERLLMKAGEWDWSEVLPELFLLKEARYREIIWTASAPQVITWVHLPFGTHVRHRKADAWMGTARATFRLSQVQDLIDKGVACPDDGPRVEDADEVCLVQGPAINYFPGTQGVTNALISGGFVKPGRPIVSHFTNFELGDKRGKPLPADDPATSLDLRFYRARLPSDDDFIPPEYAHVEALYVRSLARMRLGEMLLKGEEMERSIEGARWFFRASAGTPYAELRYAEFLLTQKECLDPEEAANTLWELLEECECKGGDWSEYTDKAVALLNKGAKDGHAAVQRKLGQAYLHRWAHPKGAADAYMERWVASGRLFYNDPWPNEWEKEGIKWFRLAAQQGDEEAAQLLQDELERGKVCSTPPPELSEPDDFRVERVRELERMRQYFHLDDGKVYAIYDAVANRPIYVGQTRGDLESRISRYREEMAEDRENPRPIIRKLRELGENGHYFRVVERNITNQGELDLAEEYWVAKLGTYHRGYNMTASGQYSGFFRHRRR